MTRRPGATSRPGGVTPDTSVTVSEDDETR